MSRRRISLDTYSAKACVFFGSIKLTNPGPSLAEALECMHIQNFPWWRIWFLLGKKVLKCIWNEELWTHMVLVLYTCLIKLLSQLTVHNVHVAASAAAVMWGVWFQPGAACQPSVKTQSRRKWKPTNSNSHLSRSCFQISLVHATCTEYVVYRCKSILPAMPPTTSYDGFNFDPITSLVDLKMLAKHQIHRNYQIALQMSIEELLYS